MDFKKKCLGVSCLFLFFLVVSLTVVIFYYKPKMTESFRYCTNHGEVNFKQCNAPNYVESFGNCRSHAEEEFSNCRSHTEEEFSNCRSHDEEAY